MHTPHQGGVLTHPPKTSFIRQRQGALYGQPEAAPGRTRGHSPPQKQLEAPGPQPQPTSRSGRTTSQHHTVHSPQDRRHRAALEWRFGLRCGHRPPGPQRRRKHSGQSPLGRERRPLRGREDPEAGSPSTLTSPSPPCQPPVYKG